MTQQTTERSARNWPPTNPWTATVIGQQGTMNTATDAAPLENMLHATSLAGRAVGTRPVVGEPAPDVELVGTDGVTRTLADFRGKPLVLRFSRAVSETMVCPLCVPGLLEFNTVYDDFEAAGIQVAVVFSTDPDVTAKIPAAQGLEYPLHSNASWDAYRAYDTGHMMMAPRQAWAIIDADGILRWDWRLIEDGSTVALPSEVLAIARDLFPS